MQKHMFLKGKWIFLFFRFPNIPSISQIFNLAFSRSALNLENLEVPTLLDHALSKTVTQGKILYNKLEIV